MPKIDRPCTEIDNLKTYFEKNWLRKFFFPTELVTELNKKNSSLFQIFKLINTPFFRNVSRVLNFFSSANNQLSFFDEPRVKLWTLLKNTGWLDIDCAQDIFNIVLFSDLNSQIDFNLWAAHPAGTEVASAIITLNKCGLLNMSNAKINFHVLVTHKFPNCLAQALVKLQEQGLLTTPNAQDNLDAVSCYSTSQEINNQGPLDIADALIQLSESGLLSTMDAQANRNTISVHSDPKAMAQALIKLKQRGLLIQANRTALVAHINPDAVSMALIDLNDENLLITDDDQANRNALTNHSNPISVAQALIRLNKCGLLSTHDAQANRNAVVAHTDPSAVSLALRKLNQAGLLSTYDAQENRDALVTSVCQFPLDIASALIETLNYTLKSPEVLAARNAIKIHNEPRRLSKDLVRLNQKGLLSTHDAQTNRDALMGHSCSTTVAGLLIMLHEVDLLSTTDAQANRDAIVSQKSSLMFFEMLYILRQAGLLASPNNAQGNFNHLIQHVGILCDDVQVRSDLWIKIKQISLTPSLWANIVEICKKFQETPVVGRQQIIAYITSELGCDHNYQASDTINCGNDAEKITSITSTNESPGISSSLSRDHLEIFPGSFFSHSSTETHADENIRGAINDCTLDK